MPLSTESVSVKLASLDLSNDFRNEELASLDDTEDTTHLAKIRSVARTMLQMQVDTDRNLDFSDLFDVPIPILQELHAAVSQIVVVKHGDNRQDGACQRFLSEFKGVTSSVDPNLLQALYHRGNQGSLPARVADFNENIAYSMSDQRGLAYSLDPSCGDGVQELINDFEDSLREATGILCGLDYQGSFLRTESATIPQPAHVDFTWDYLDSTQAEDVRIGFFPLTRDGMVLQLWSPKTSGARFVAGRTIFIPYGTLLLVPCHTIHGGGFRTAGGQGNLRFHLYVGKDLPDHQQNTYTQPGNKSRELCEQYVDAEILHEESIMRKVLFE